MRRRRVPWVAAVALFIGSAAAADRQPAATVQVASGTVTVRRQAATASVPLRPREALYVGDVVNTGADGRATLVFSDGSQARLNVNSAVEITAATSVGKGKQSLFRAILGEIWSRLRPGKAARTRSAIAGVRGTEFHLLVEDDGTTTLTVLVGEVDFFNDYGAVAVGESQQSVASPDAAPTAPVTIENAGLIIEWTVDLERAIIPRERFYISPDHGALEDETQAREERARTDPDDADARRDYGDVLFDTGRYEEALGEYREADRIAPDQPAILTRLGDALLELRQTDEAIEAYNAALGADPQHAPALVGLAWTGLARNRLEEAQDAAERAVAADANSAQARVVLGLALMRQAGTLADAAPACQAALNLEPAAYRYQARAWLALVHLAQDDPGAALEEAQAAVELAPQSALAHGNLALTCFFSGKPGLAKREARLATKLAPDSTAARCALGQALLVEGDLDAAAEAVGQAVGMDPGLAQGHYLLGVIDAQRRNYRAAARELRACLSLAPRFLPAASALARVYQRMGREDEAVALLTELLPQHPRADEVLAALGGAYYRQSRFKDSIAQYQEALKIRPNSALYHAELSRVLIDANRLNEAIAAGQKATRLSPDVGQYHAILGLAYDYSRLDAQAEREFREALALDPENALARLALGLRSAQVGPREQRIFPKASGQSLADLVRQAQQAVGSTSVVSTVTQAFLHDPAVSEQVLKGGVDGEITVAGGNQRPPGGSVTHRATAADGAFHSFAVASRSKDEGTGANDDVTTMNVSADLTYTPGPQTTWFARASYNRNKQGLSDPAFTWDVDDRADTRDTLLQLAMRERVTQDASLWLGLSRHSQRLEITDEDMDSRTVLVLHPGIADPVHSVCPSQEVAADNWVPEVRVEIPLNDMPDRRSVLSLGLARQSLDIRSNADFMWQFGPPPEWRTSNTRLDGSLLMGYVQLAQRVNDDLSFIAQLRSQRLRTASLLSLGNQSVGPVKEKESCWLPALLVNYRTGRRDLVRLLYNHQAPKQELTPVALVPNEALMVTEPLVLPKGSLGETRTAEVEYERYLSPDSFIKVFLFHTTADDVNLGPLPRMREVQRTGVGFRYERQLTRNLWMQAAYLYNRTDNDTPFAPFDGGTAPYHPLHLGGVALNYVDQTGTKIGLQVNCNGRFFQDSDDLSAPDRPIFGSRAYVDLLLAKEPSVETEYFLKVSNLLNEPALEFAGFPADARRIVAGGTWRF